MHTGFVADLVARTKQFSECLHGLDALDDRLLHLADLQADFNL